MKFYEGVSSNSCLSRVVEGVASYFFASKRRPTIRFSQSSTNCAIFAKEINVRSQILSQPGFIVFVLEQL